LSEIRNTSTRRSRGIFYIPIQNRFFLILTVILGIVLSLLFINIIGSAFKTLFPSMGAYIVSLVLATCLLGSYVNIPVKRYRTQHPIIRVSRVTVFGVTYPVPSLRVGFYETLLAVNVGGAIVPTVTSIYLMAKTPSALLPYVVVAIIVVAGVVKFFSKPVKGVGIVVPVLIPPIAAASAGTLLGSGYFSHVVAYVSGTLGTLVGADLLNLHQIPKMGTPIASIGGAGTFDGIFLAGIIAVLIAF